MLFLNHKLTEDSPLYGNSGSIELRRTSQIANNNSSNNSFLSFSSHAGTHIDSPYHFDNSGNTLDEYSADFWICNKPYLIEKRLDKDEIIRIEKYKEEFESIPVNSDILIFKTGFEKFREPELLKKDLTYIFNNPGFHPDIGLWLRKNRNLKMIGFDFISLSSYRNRELGRIAHRAFLSANPDGSAQLLFNSPILIIEDMKLSTLVKCPSRVIVAPFLYSNADGAPVTVIAEF